MVQLCGRSEVYVVAAPARAALSMWTRVMTRSETAAVDRVAAADRPVAPDRPATARRPPCCPLRRPSRALVLAAALLAWAGAGAPAAGQVSAADDRRLSEQAMQDLARACKDGNFAAAEARTRGWLFQRLARGPLDRLQAPTDMVYVLRACRYLALADRIDKERKLSAWLAGRRDVSRLLFRALEEVPSPEESLRKFQSLLAADEKKVLAYVNLSVAMATSLPFQHYVRQPKPASMLESFGWYTDPNIAFRCDLKALPMEMCRYLADTQLSLDERRWALNKYAQMTDLPSVYFQVQYDMDYFFKGTPKKISKVDYTLPNLLQYGGICIDQAYFTSQVCKALGMPAAIVGGHNAAGEPHAWIACVKTRRQGARTLTEWDTQTARWEEQKFYTGTVVDPASGQRIHDSELVLLGAAMSLPLDRREEADAATTLAAMVAEAIKSQSDELKAAGKIGPAVVEQLLVEAVNRNLAHKRAWELAIRLRQSGQLSTDCLDRLFALLVDRTAKDYPDYSCSLALRIVPTYEAARREKIYQRGAEVYSHRPDLQAQLLIALGDDYAAQGKKDQALKTYRQVVAEARELTEILLIAARRAENVMVAGGHRDQAFQMYKQLFGDVRKGNPRAADYTQSAYYQLGRRLSELLGEDGQADAARQIRRKIGNSTRTIEGNYGPGNGT